MTQTIAAPEIKNREKKEISPMDDDDHSYDYVIEMLQKIFCFSVQQALQHAVEVHTGRTILITCGLEEAEFARD